MRGKEEWVLVPGLLCDGALWRHQVHHLAEIANITIPDLAQHDSIAGMAHAVLSRAPARFALAGLSMGGYVALGIVRQAPDRVSRLALLDTSARPDTPEQTGARKELIQLSESGKFGDVVPSLLPRLVHPGRIQDLDLVNTVVEMANRVGKDAFARQQHAIMSRPDSREYLKLINCPTLVLCGRQDAITPLAVHEEMAVGIDQARLAVIEECGHMSTLERPHAVTALLRMWLLYG
jgi:pimeloyl-ACP methyl ester carboxylesterase